MGEEHLITKLVDVNLLAKLSNCSVECTERLLITGVKTSWVIFGILTITFCFYCAILLVFGKKFLSKYIAQWIVFKSVCKEQEERISDVADKFREEGWGFQVLCPCFISLDEYKMIGKKNK